MKHFLRFFFILMIIPTYVFSQTYYHTSISNLTGFNRDIIASGNYGVSSNFSTPKYTLNPKTESPFDKSGGKYGGYILFGANYSLDGAATPTGSLPLNGAIASSWNSESHNYQLQSYSQNNSLWLDGNGTSTGTLTLGTAATYQNLYILSIAANGSNTTNLTVNYTTGTALTTSITGQDWIGGTSSSSIGVLSNYSALIAASDVSGQTGNTDATSRGNTKLFEYNILVDGTRKISNIQFQNTNNGQMNILAITGSPSAVISGTVFSDGTDDNTINGSGTNAGAGYAVLTYNDSSC